MVILMQLVRDMILRQKMNQLEPLNIAALDYGRSSKLAVLLHADIVGSTLMVQRNEAAAHERIKMTFQRFSEVIDSYQGRVREIRGDALVAQLERASDAVTATLAFQDSQVRHNEKSNDDILPELRVGIALGEVIIDDHIVTGPGVVLAQRVEQLATPGGLCITAAIHEALPTRMPFDQVDLGDNELKGFDEKVRVYRVAARHGVSIPTPHKAAKPGFSFTVRKLMKPMLVSVLIIGAGVVIGISYEHISRPVQTEPHWLAPAIETARKNPVKATPESLELGASVYRKNCVSCHGDNTDGDGLAGRNLKPKPANLHMMSKSHADGEIAYKIRVGRGAMPGWEGVLGEDEIWSLVNYIRSIHELYPEETSVSETIRNSSDDLTH